MKVSKEFRFEASHQISNHPGKCARLHGHSWILTVECEGRRNEAIGMVVDFFDIKESVQPMIDLLDHRHLGWGEIELQWKGETPGFEPWILPATVVTNIPLPLLPTCENLLWWMADYLEETAPLLPWSALSLNETCTTSATLTRSEYTGSSERKEQSHGKAEDGPKEDGKESRQEEAEEVTQLCDVCHEPLRYKRGSTVSDCRHMVKLGDFQEVISNAELFYKSSAPTPRPLPSTAEIDDDDITF